MVISKTAAKRNRQHNYGCKKVAKVDGENVKYQVCAYPFGNSSGPKKDSFNMVIKLLSNPSFLNLKAVYEFYFEDKNGKPYKRKGESTFGELTVSSEAKHYRLNIYNIIRDIKVNEFFMDRLPGVLHNEI